MKCKKCEHYSTHSDKCLNCGNKFPYFYVENIMVLKNKTYQGVITSLPSNGIFVYGANTEGRHGMGAAKVAREKFGAIYGKTGLQGQSYGIITKDLGATSHPSVSVDAITKQILDLYKFARTRPDLEFYVAYSGRGKNLNGYTPEQMAGMFMHFPVPNNIVFEEEFYKLK
jgi:hypothetical protein